MNKKEDFDVVIASAAEDGTEVVTAASEMDIASWEDAQIYAAVRKYTEAKPIYSAYTEDAGAEPELTVSSIDELASDLNSNITSLLTANAIIRKRVLTDELIGRTYEAVYSNVNTEFQLSYPHPEGCEKTAERAREITEDFNRQVDLPSVIRESISGTFLEGNKILSLRTDGANHAIDFIPLGIAFVSDYLSNGSPVLCIDIKRLESGLKKTYGKNRKRRAAFFEDVKADIKANYPSCVYDDYISGETESRLDPEYAKIIRINNMSRKYGVSPIFRALKPLVVLDSLTKTDITMAKSKQRKILLQLLRREVITDLKKKGLAEAVHAHGQLMAALSTTSCAYTAAPFVESLSYVAPPPDDTDAEKRAQYQRSVLNALGIEFADTQSGTVSVAVISLNQLLRLVNAIGEQLERVIHQYYEKVLELNGLDPIYAPRIRIIDSEQLDASLRKDLAAFIYSTLGASLETTFRLLGIDIEDEKIKRENENDKKVTDIFYPRPTSYTTAGTERNSNTDEYTDTEKQERDKAKRELEKSETTLSDAAKLGYVFGQTEE